MPVDSPVASARVVSDGTATMASALPEMLAGLRRAVAEARAGIELPPGFIKASEIILSAIEGLATECATFLPAYRGALEDLRRTVEAS